MFNFFLFGGSKVQNFLPYIVWGSAFMWLSNIQKSIKKILKNGFKKAFIWEVHLKPLSRTSNQTFLIRLILMIIRLPRSIRIGVSWLHKVIPWNLYNTITKENHKQSNHLLTTWSWRIMILNNVFDISSNQIIG